MTHAYIDTTIIILGVILNLGAIITFFNKIETRLTRLETKVEAIEKKLP